MRVDRWFALLAGRQLERQEVLQDAIGQVQLLLEESLPSRLLHHERLGEGCLRESVSGTINLLELLYLKQYMYLAA